MDLSKVKSVLDILKYKFRNYKEYASMFRMWSNTKNYISQDDFLSAIHRIGIVMLHNKMGIKR